MKILSVLLVLLVTFSEIKADNSVLPAPYNELVELLPFNDFGWYVNGSYLKALIKKHKVKTVIEVGCFLGKSTRHIATCIPKEGKVYAVDHWKGSSPSSAPLIVPLDQLYAYFLSNTIHANLTDKIVPIKQSSLLAAQELAVTADLIYIDASHDTESVYNDLNAWYPHLNVKGILCGDDWGWDSVQIAVLQFSQEHPELFLRAKGNFYFFVNK